jgi:nucleoside diphosphate kinase
VDIPLERTLVIVKPDAVARGLVGAFSAGSSGLALPSLQPS